MPRKQNISKTDAKNDLRAGQTKRMKDALLEELAKYPIIQIACQRTGVGRSTFYKWKKQDKKFSDIADDMAESQLIKAIGNGNMTGIIFWLKNNHADYTDRVRYEHHYEHHIDDYTEEESAKTSRALVNIGLANILKRKGFTYTKEEAEEAERIRTIWEMRREKSEKQLGDSFKEQNTGADIENEEDASETPTKGRMVNIREALSSIDQNRQRAAENSTPKHKGRTVDLKKFFSELHPKEGK